MKQPSENTQVQPTVDIVQILFQDYGRTFAEELDIHIENNTPSALFRLLCTSLLCSARIRGATA